LTFTETVAERAEVPVFALAVRRRVAAVPVPEAGDTVTQEADDSAVQAALGVSDSEYTPPPAPGVQLSVFAAAPAWVTLMTQIVTPLILTDTVALRDEVPVFAPALNLMVVAAPVPELGETVTHEADDAAVHCPFGLPVTE
jgi:hypothetical protein